METEFGLPQFNNQEMLIVNKVEEFAIGLLSEGRKDWDIPHTLSVVYYVRLLAAENNRRMKRNPVDEMVLIVAALMHDTGYYGLFAQSLDSDNYGGVQDKKAAHMIAGRMNVQKLFDENQDLRDYFSENRREKIKNLVAVHDYIDKLKTPEEIILGQADTLGSIDVRRVTPTFDPKSAREYLDKSLDGKRAVLFRSSFEIMLLHENRQLFENLVFRGMS